MRCEWVISASIILLSQMLAAGAKLQPPMVQNEANVCLDKIVKEKVIATGISAGDVKRTKLFVRGTNADAAMLQVQAKEPKGLMSVDDITTPACAASTTPKIVVECAKAKFQDKHSTLFTMLGNLMTSADINKAFSTAFCPSAGSAIMTSANACLAAVLLEKAIEAGISKAEALTASFFVLGTTGTFDKLQVQAQQNTGLIASTNIVKTSCPQADTSVIMPLI